MMLLVFYFGAQVTGKTPCFLCPIGSYQGEEGQTECKKCPDKQKTAVRCLFPSSLLLFLIVFLQFRVLLSWNPADKVCARARMNSSLAGKDGNTHCSLTSASFLSFFLQAKGSTDASACGQVVPRTLVHAWSVLGHSHAVPRPYSDRLCCSDRLGPIPIVYAVCFRRSRNSWRVTGAMQNPPPEDKNEL